MGSGRKASPANHAAPASLAQVDKFRDKARELECDDDETTFAERVKRMALTPKAPAKLPHE